MCVCVCLIQGDRTKFDRLTLNLVGFADPNTTAIVDNEYEIMWKGVVTVCRKTLPQDTVMYENYR